MALARAGCPARATLKGSRRCPPTIVPKRKLVQIHLELPSTDAMVCADQPLLKIADRAVRQRHDGFGSVGLLVRGAIAGSQASPVLRQTPRGMPRMPPISPEASWNAQARAAERARDPETRGNGQVPLSLHESPKPVVVALLTGPPRGRHGDDHRPFAHGLNCSRTSRAVRRRETVRRSDDSSHRKVQNARGTARHNGGDRWNRIDSLVWIAIIVYNSVALRPSLTECWINMALLLAS
jgi:hypothetical protein